ncbi:MAG: glycosyltransferase family 2 protein [Lentisphaerae bacterium]|nr:glycosyltransferase family 2 protein [Lentisphaerota bacterium]
MNYQNVFVIVPCYNEELCIKKTLLDLRQTCPDIKIIAVNDGSSDNSLQQLKSIEDPQLVVLDIPINSGIGTAVQTGLLYASRNHAEYAVKFDGDGQHLATEIVDLLNTLMTTSTDLVIGSRFLINNSGFKSSFMRRIGIRLFKYLSGLLTGVPISDATSGFRAYNRRGLEFAAEYYPSFDYPEPEECILFLRNNFIVREIPCKMAERQGGTSSIKSYKALYFMVKVSLAMIMERFRSLKTKRSI